MKRQKHALIPAIVASGLLAILATAGPFARATDYTWTTTGTTGHDWTGANARWSPSEGAPAADTDNAVFSGLSSSTAVNLNGDFSINNLSVAGSGGTTLTLRAAGGARTFALAGTLTKSANSNTVLFAGDGDSTLDLTIASLSLTTGTYRFGSTTAATALKSLSVGAVTMGTSNGSAAIDLNVNSDYSLGQVNFTGGGTSSRTINLVNSTGAATSRTVTVKGISQSTGAVAVIAASKTAASTGVHAVTLVIDTDAATTFTATTTLTDGAGGTLALLKTGTGRQELSGSLTHTGGTTVEAGTLVVSGSLAPEGDLAVSAGATFVAGNALSLGNMDMESGAIIGFNLDAVSSLNITGDLRLSGAGEATFIIDFGNTGVFNNNYTGLLSIAGSNAFQDATVSYINFGATGQSGTLSFTELTSGFTIGAAVPEPAATTLSGALAILGFAAFRRKLAALRA
ncbi:autotransporter-associated beta strand repeat protein [Opitutaceae bacterium TAV1]|nr:autotransporter-associated beta strand repeat protein [Opitutaceae bacterium TAV1]